MRTEHIERISSWAAVIENYAKNARDFPNRYAILASARNIQRLCLTQPITYRRSPLWKVALSRILLALSKAITRIEAGWWWLCKKLNAHPIEVLILLVALGYVAVLVAQVARHMAFGIW